MKSNDSDSKTNLVDWLLQTINILLVGSNKKLRENETGLYRLSDDWLPWNPYTSTLKHTWSMKSFGLIRKYRVRRGDSRLCVTNVRAAVFPRNSC